MLAETRKGACEVNLRCLAPSFVSCLDFICTEFAVPLQPVVVECLTWTQTDSKCLPNELQCIWVLSGCLAPSFLSCLDLICTEFAVPVATRGGGMFNTDSDGFEKLAKRATVHMSPFRVFGTQFCFIPRFHTHQVYYARWVESISLTRALLKCVPKWATTYMMSVSVFGSQYYFVPANSCGEKFNTELDGFEMHAELS